MAGDSLAESKEDFRAASSFVQTKNPSPSIEEHIRFILFDMIDPEGLSNAFSTRLPKLAKSVIENKHVRILPQQPISQSECIQELIRTSRLWGWEGVMLRRDSPHQGGRSKDLVKVKDFVDAEFRIVGYDLGPMEVMRDGSYRTETVLAALHVEHKGNVVKVGSGFSLEERRQLAGVGDELVGRWATVCYFEETQTDGRASLRFPTFKALITK